MSLHAVALGGIAWATTPWRVRVAAPEEVVLVTLLAAGAAARPGAAAPGGASEPLAAAPEAPAVAPPPAPARPARSTASPPRPRAREERRAPSPPVARAPAAGSPPAAGPGSAPPDGAGGQPSAAAGTPLAAVAPGAGGAGAGDNSRVYGEGEVDRVAAPVGGIRRPEYPARERMMGREGRVSLRVTVDAAGAVREVSVARSGGAAFDASARRAVERTPFRAARLAERPVPSTVTVEVSFELD